MRDLLVAGGMLCLIVAGFILDPIVGFAVAGVLLLLVGVLRGMG